MLKETHHLTVRERAINRVAITVLAALVLLALPLHAEPTDSEPPSSKTIAHLLMALERDCLYQVPGQPGGSQWYDSRPPDLPLLTL